MRDFYKDLARHSVGIFLRALVRTDTTFDILSKLILAVLVGVSNPVADAALGVWNWLTDSEVRLNGVPLWWSWVLLGIIFLHGLFRYVYEDKQRVEREREQLRGEDKAAAEKRRALQTLLGDAQRRGQQLAAERYHGNSEDTERAIEQWIQETYDLIEDAFGRQEAETFLSNDGYAFDEREYEITLGDVRYNTLHIDARLWRLRALGEKAYHLPINPHFDPKSAVQQIRESTAGRISLAVAVERAKQLEKEIEQVTAERDAFEVESRKYKNELDGQIRGHCLELTDELSDFLTLNRALEPEEIMRRYEGEFRSKVDRLRLNLIRLGWWKPGRDVKQKLEYPETPDHLWSIYHYLRDIGVGLKGQMDPECR